MTWALFLCLNTVERAHTHPALWSSCKVLHPWVLFLQYYSFILSSLISHYTTHLLLLSSSLVPVVLLRRFSSTKRSNLRTGFHPAFILQVPWSLPPPKHQFPSSRKKMATRVTLKRKQMLIIYSNFVKRL